jgi:protein gp37
MSANTKIEWADHTFNPWEGCQKVGPGCDHCYAETRNARFAGGQAINWGAGAPRRRTSEDNWHQPIKWNTKAARLGIRYRVFCASLADVFDNAVNPSWRADLFDLIEKTPNLDWLLLTKRIGNVPSMMIDVARHLFWMDHLDSVRVLPNVWLGATIVNQEEADRDIPKLLQVPAAKRFLSMEPLLGPVDLSPWLAIAGSPPQRMRYMHNKPLHWVIVGGESGPGARPMHPDWARSLRDQCQAAGVPFLFKQWGEWLPAKDGRSITGKTLVLEGAAPFTDHPKWHGFANGQQVARVGKKAAGRQLDGRTWDEVPA